MYVKNFKIFYLFMLGATTHADFRVGHNGMCEIKKKYVSMHNSESGTNICRTGILFKIL